MKKGEKGGNKEGGKGWRKGRKRVRKGKEKGEKREKKGKRKKGKEVKKGKGEGALHAEVPTSVQRITTTPHSTKLAKNRGNHQKFIFASVFTASFNSTG